MWGLNGRTFSDEPPGAHGSCGPNGADHGRKGLVGHGRQTQFAAGWVRTWKLGRGLRFGPWGGRWRRGAQTKLIDLLSPFPPKPDLPAGFQKRPDLLLCPPTTYTDSSTPSP